MKIANCKLQIANWGRCRRGFTLVELLLVLVILALIGGLVLPGIIGKAEGAKVKAAGSQISRLEPFEAAYRRGIDLFTSLRAGGMALRRLDLLVDRLRLATCGGRFGRISNPTEIIST